MNTRGLTRRTVVEWISPFRLTSWHRWAIVIAALAASACGSTADVENADDCRSVIVTTARNNVDDSGRGTATVTIDPKDVSVRKLLCVADRLEQQHPGWADVRVAVFDSTDAADQY